MAEKRADEPARPPWLNALVGAALVGGLATLCYVVFTSTSYQMRWERAWESRVVFAKGWLLTVIVSLASLVISTLIGVALVVGQRSGLPSLRIACQTFVEIIRSTPLLTQLLVGFYVVAPVFGLQNEVWSGILILSVFAGAYLAEIFRGGIESIGKSQFEAARAVGFDRWQIYRFVIIPQTVRRVMPGVAGTFVNLIKDSSLLSVIGVSEFTRQVQSFAARTMATYEGYLPLAFGYLLLTLPITWWARSLERRFGYET